MLPLGDDNLPGRGLAFLTVGLIALNVAVFLLLQEAMGENAFTYGWSAIPLEISTGVDHLGALPITIGGQVYSVPQASGPSPIQLTLLSSMFMHGDFVHLGGNMLYLWIFGDNVEHRLGRPIFIVVYLLAGLVGSLAQIASDPTSPIPTLGASGAISGVLGAYLVLFPGNRVTAILIRVLVKVPALWAIGLWIALQVFESLVTEPGGGGVAYLAHFGGFVTGALAALLLRNRPDLSLGRAG
ncbi:MAG TPA: rhomboid family intramembrane serine protease [Candidatus Limnocylindria bacterium]|nr:rhomboid family intramembrane serine protease [Candidatus Limnocylindria bacterium]